MQKFNQLDTFTKTDVMAAIDRDTPDELLYVPVAVSLNGPDLVWATTICIRLASHDHALVRGNAVLGFGHLARRGADLPKNQVIPLVKEALHHTDDFVCHQATAAADDLRLFLGWKIE